MNHASRKQIERESGFHELIHVHGEMLPKDPNRGYKKIPLRQGYMLTREMQIGNLSSNPDKVPETLKKAECTINDTLRLATFPKFRPDRNILIG